MLFVAWLDVEIEGDVLWRKTKKCEAWFSYLLYLFHSWGFFRFNAHA